MLYIISSYLILYIRRLIETKDMENSNNNKNNYEYEHGFEDAAVLALLNCCNNLSILDILRIQRACSSDQTEINTNEYSENIQDYNDIHMTAENEEMSLGFTENDFNENECTIFNCIPSLNHGDKDGELNCDDIDDIYSLDFSENHKNNQWKLEIKEKIKNKDIETNENLKIDNISVVMFNCF